MGDDHLVALDPYVALVNVSGGRAGGKICPHTLEKMFHPVPCSFGSLQTFGTFEARDEASKSYHRFEWKVLAALQRVGVIERAQLALRMLTKQPTMRNWSRRPVPSSSAAASRCPTSQKLGL